MFLSKIIYNKNTFYKLKIIFIYILQSLDHNKTSPIQRIYKIAMYVSFEI